eukprot:COSAG06_NODE_2211_length_7334_cov_4.392122_5_plen_46_part_01
MNTPHWFWRPFQPAVVLRGRTVPLLCDAEMKPPPRSALALPRPWSS